MSTKTDRELIELAAKAVGYDGYWHDGFGGQFIVTNKDGGLPFSFNPLSCDGDALRLTVDLNLTLFPIGGGESTGKAIGCRYKFTRRAITVTAAEIGEGMK